MKFDGLVSENMRISQFRVCHMYEVYSICFESQCVMINLPRKYSTIKLNNTIQISG